MPTGILKRALPVVFLMLGSATEAEVLAQADEPQREVPKARAHRIDDDVDIDIDGRLDESIWQDAIPISGFRQREPFEGEAATEDTEVRVLYNGQTLYIGIIAYDSEPDRIVARSLERDSPIGAARFGPGGGDDAVEVILDTFHDRRNAFYFATNPKGVIVDGYITDENFRVDRNWDAVWNVAASTTSEGWVAEFEIPLRTIRFYGSSEPQTWGFNVQRVIARKLEQSLWTSWSRDNEGLNRISRAGELTDLEQLPATASFQLKPFVLGQAGQNYDSRPDGDILFDGNVGLDAKYTMVSGLVLDLTVNTDFAQVEADEEQIDLTRFSLFFPEKREFFLENAGIFQFGTGGGFRAPDLLLFFSRRIGIEDNLIVPMIAGARMSGRTGKQTIGFLNVLTGRDGDAGAPLTNFAVGRVKRDIGRQSYLGAIATGRVEEGGRRNVTGGIDWNFWLTQNMALEGFVAGVAENQPSFEDYAAQVNLDYTGDVIGWRVGHFDIGPNMFPGIGFVRRTNIGETSGSLRVTPRPQVLGLRLIDIRNSFNYITTQRSRQVLDKRWEINISPEWNTGDEVRLEANWNSQTLLEDFELEDDIIVPPGLYEDWTLSGEVSSSRARTFFGELGGGGGGFWDGNRWFIDGSVAFNSPHVGLELGYNHNDIDVPAGSFKTDLIRSRIKLALNTKLFGNALIQYNSQSGAFSANVRINFIYRPGSDLFIVFNETRGVSGGRWNPEARALVIKLTYLHWF
jgi:hypothetical protein